MADNYIEIQLDTSGVVSGAEDIVEVLSQTGEEAGEAFSENVNDSIDIQYDEVIRQLQEILPKIEELQNKMRDAQNTEGTNTEYYRQLEAEFNTLVAQSEELRAKAEELSEALAVEPDTEGIEGIGEAAEESAETIEQLGENMQETFSPQRAREIRGVNSAISNMGKSSNGMASGLQKGIAKFAALALSMRTIRRVIGMVVRAYKEGLGNLVKYSDTTDKMMQQLNGSITSVKNALAAAFNPVITAILPALTLFINRIVDVINTMGMLVARLTGQKTFIAAKKDIDGTTDALKGAGGAAKEASKQLAGFDELNNLSSNSGGGGGGSDVKDMFETLDVDEATAGLDKVEQIIGRIKEGAKQLGDAFKEGFLSSLTNAPAQLENIRSNLGRIAESLKTIFTNVDLTNAFKTMLEKMAYAAGQITGAFLSVGLTIGQLVIGGIAEFLEDNSDFITEELTRIFENIGGIAEQWGEFAEAMADIFSVFGGENGQKLLGDLIGIFADAYLEVYDIMTRLGEDVLTLITQPFINNKDEIKNALDGVLGVLDSIAETIRTGLIDAFQEFNAMYDEHIKPLFDSLTEGLSEIYNQVYSSFNEYILPVLNDFADDFAGIWDEYVQPVLSDAIDLIGTVADAIKELWERVLQPLISWFLTNIVPVIVPYLRLLWSMVTTAFKGIMIVIDGAINHIKLIIQGFIALISGDWEGFWNSLSGIVDNVMDTVQKLLGNYTEGYSEIFTNLWETLKGIINMILSGVESLANGVVSGLNKVFEGFDKIGDKEIKNPFTGETATIGFSIPQLDKITIPRLATGAVIPANSEFLAVLGDQKKGTNIEAPLDTIKAAVAEVIGNMGYGSDEPIIIQIDGREVFRAVRNQSRIYTKSTGRPALY